MPNEIYHRSEWGNPKAEDFGDVYFDPAATNKLYKHSDYYENSDGTDKILRDIPNKASIVLTPTAYSDGSLNTVIPPYQVLPQELVTNGDFSDGTNNWSASNASFEVVNGELKIYNQTSSPASVLQVISGLEVGKKYKVTATSRLEGSGGATARVSFFGNIFAASTSVGQSVTQSIEITATVTSATLALYLYGTSSTEGYFDNISVKEVQQADFDFSRGSSATRVNEKGLIEDVASNIPRIDYTSGQGALLLEPQSTNLFLNSANLSTQDVTTTATSFSVSFYGTGTITFSGTHTGTLTGTGVNERVSVTFTPTSGTLTCTVSGSVTNAQIENLSYSTSYIPTEGATVTRSADVANNSGNADLFNDSEGVLYAEILKKQDDNDTYILISLNNDASNADTNSVTLGFDADDDFYFRVKSNGSDVLKSIGITANKNQFYKVAVKYKSGDCAVWIDGVEQVTSTTAFTFGQTLDNLSFDFNGNGSLAFYGNVKSLAVFKEALTDEELQALTT